MSKIDAMRDPLYAQILFAVESALADVDRAAREAGFTMTDSAIRSVLVRALKEARGKSTQPLGDSGRERWMREAASSLVQARGQFRVAKGDDEDFENADPLPARDWITALEAARESCVNRTGLEPGSRAYLDFIADFIESARPLSTRVMPGSPRWG